MIKTIIAVLSIDLFHWAYRNWAKLTLVLALASWLVVVSWPRLTRLSPRLAGGSDIKIVFCSAGQGDETLIQRGFTQILIDGSRPGRALDCLRKHVPFFDRQIEMVVATHPQIDHFGGLTDVLKRYKVMSFVYNGLRGDSHEWEIMSQAILAEGAEIEVVAAGDEIRVGELKLKVVWPESAAGADGFSRVARQDSNQTLPMGPSSLSEHPFKQFAFRIQSFLTGVQFPRKTSSPAASANSVLGVSRSGEPNSSAIVMALSYGDFEALFTSDIGEEEEKEIIRSTGQQVNRLEKVDVLKVAHHGSKYSSSLDFLKTVRPTLAVIEVGKNSYGHPTAEALERLREVGARVMRTDQDGDVVVTTNGDKWEVKNKRLRYLEDEYP